MRIALLVIALIGAPLLARSANAIILTDGDQADQLIFLEMMNTASTAGAWTLVPVPSTTANELVFQPTSGSQNIFTLQTRAVADDEDHIVILSIKQSWPGVFVGNFDGQTAPGEALQRIDLRDLVFLPTNDPVLLLRSSAILHEIAEAHFEAVNGLGFDPAHGWGELLETQDLFARRGPNTPRRIPGTDESLVQVPGELLVDMRFPWMDPLDPSTQFVAFRMNAQFVLSNIHVGILSHGEPYDGTDLDVEATDVFVVPEPQPILSLGTGVLVLLALRRTRCTKQLDSCPIGHYPRAIRTPFNRQRNEIQPIT